MVMMVTDVNLCAVRHRSRAQDNANLKIRCTSPQSLAALRCFIVPTSYSRTKSLRIIISPLSFP